MMLTQNEIILCAIVGAIALLLAVLSVVLMRGKGAWLIAGYNTMSQKEKERYDSAALCRFLGKYLLTVALVMPALPVGAILGLDWLIAAYVLYLLLSAVAVIVYCNTGNRFKK